MNTRRTLRSSSRLSNTSEKAIEPLELKANVKQLKEHKLVAENVEDSLFNKSTNRKQSLSEKGEGTVKPKACTKQLKETNLASKEDDYSSSDSSVGDYLKSADDIDLNSTFFKFEATPKPDFESIEKNIFSDVQRLSESDESGNENFTIVQNEPKTINFSQLHSYSSKLEEAKKCVEKYKSKSSNLNKKEDIKRLLSIGETSGNNESKEDSFDDSSEFGSEDGMEWEEIKEEKPSNPVKIPKEGVQITVQLPNAIQHKKKKKIDFIAVIKRRINRIKKENQIYVHKVHLLCWIAHGNFVNSVLNNENLMGLALSLLPSDKCYPPKRPDISYLEQIVKWFGKMMKLQERPENEERIPLQEALETQISKKQVWSKAYFVYIFIIILRAIGLECRLILSFQCLPLRPPSSELCSLSTKDPKNEESSSKTDSKNLNIKSNNAAKKPSSKLNVSSSKIRPSKETSKIKQKIESNKDQSKTKMSIDKSLSDKPAAKEEVKKSAKNNSTKNLVKDMKKSENNSSKITKRTSSQSNAPKIKISQMDGVDDELSTSKLRKGVTAKDDKNSKPSKNKNANKPSVEALEKIKSHQKSNSKNTRPNLKTICADKTNEPSVSKIPKISKSNLKILASTSKTQKTTKPDLKAISAKKTDGSSAFEVPKISNLNQKTLVQGAASTSKTQKTTKPNLKAISAKKTDGSSAFEFPKISNLNQKTLVQGAASTSKTQKTTKPNLKAIGAKPNLKTVAQEVTSTSKTQKIIKPNLKALKPNNSKESTQNNSRKTKMKDTDNSSDSDFKLNSSKSSEGSSTTKSSKSKKVKLDVKNDIINLLKDEIIKKKQIENMKLVKRKSHTQSDSDSDFVPETVKKRRSNSNSDTGNSSKSKTDTKVKRRIPPKSELLKREIENTENTEKKKIGMDIWAEVFLEFEEKWISVDVISGHVHCVDELQKRATQPISYSIAWNNNLTLKDVTVRYCPNWNTVTRKLRVDPTWWHETLKPYIGLKTARDKEEDEDFAMQQLDKPLPTTINEYKNHPLYVLRRHLLKFEAIYPPDAVTLGFVRNEAVYARECVYTLHSREIWVKHAKVVKPKQEPYKIVKARPKYDKLSGTLITDLPLELFGKWQVDDYVPPTAENGVVPRNAFGNVELFKSCMLPKKTVHLQLPGLNKVARKLQIDCAPAVVGFDFHAGGSHPVFDGYVVCEEFKDTVIAAWEEDQAETAKRELEKYEKRVYGNWRKLIKGLLIRERLKARYDFELTTKKGKSKKKTLKIEKKKRRVYSESEDD